jgi:hypothetical protein
MVQRLTQRLFSAEPRHLIAQKIINSLPMLAVPV